MRKDKHRKTLEVVIRECVAEFESRENEQLEKNVTGKMEAYKTQLGY